jgi:hypothetical protein
VRSKGISRILQLDLCDFLEIIKEFPDEKEIYHYYKELVTMYKHYAVLGIYCYSCKSKDHQLTECPKLFYNQNIQRILNNQARKLKDFRSSFSRNEARFAKHFSNVKKIQKAQGKFYENYFSESFI